MEGPVGDSAGTDVLDTSAAGPLVIRGAALRAVGYGLGMLLSVAAVAILIRHLGAADYGKYVTVISLIAIVGNLAEAGLTNLGIREYTILEGDRRSRVLRNLLGLRLAISLLGGAVAIVFALAAGYSGAMVAGTGIGACGVVVLNVQGAYSVPLSARLALGRVTVLELSRNVAMLVATAALAVLGADLLGFLAIPALAAVVVLGLTLVWVRGAIPLRPEFDGPTWRGLLRVTASFAAATAAGTLYVYVVVLTMSLLASDEEVGYFGASFRVFVVVASIASLLVSAAFPVLARAARDDRRRLAYALDRLFQVGVLVGAYLAIVTVVGAEVAIDVIAGPGFEPAVETLRIQAAAILASFVLAAWGFGLISLHRHFALLAANGFALALAIGLSALLVPAHGAVGAGVTTVVGETAMAGAYAIALFRGNRELRPSLHAAWKPALASALAIAAGIAVGPPIAAMVAATVVYALTVLVLRAIPAELVDAVRERTRR